MKKIMFIAAITMLFGFMLTSCTQQTPSPSPKTSIYVITTGGGSDSTKTVSKFYETSKTDTLGVVHNGGKTTTTSVTKKSPGETKLIVTETPQVQQPVTTSTATNTPWWAWTLLAIFCLGALICLILIVVHYWSRGNNFHSNLVVITPGSDFDTATRLKVLDHEHGLETKAMSIFEKAAEKGKLEDFEFNSDRLGLKGKFKTE